MHKIDADKLLELFQAHLEFYFSVELLLVSALAGAFFLCVSDRAPLGKSPDGKRRYWCAAVVGLVVPAAITLGAIGVNWYATNSILDEAFDAYGDSPRGDIVARLTGLSNWTFEVQLGMIIVALVWGTVGAIVSFRRSKNSGG